MDRRDGWKLWLWLKGAAGGQERPRPLGSGARNIASGHQRHLSYALPLLQEVFLPHSRVRIQHRSWHSRHESLEESSVMVLTRFRDTETRCSRCAVLGSLPNTGIPRRVWPCGGLSNRSPLLRLQLRQRRLQSLELLETPENLTSRIRTGWACMARP